MFSKEWCFTSSVKRDVGALYFCWAYGVIAPVLKLLIIAILKMTIIGVEQLQFEDSISVFVT